MYIADMHCDTIYELLLKKERGEPARLRENDLHVDLRRMKEAGYMLQNFALFVNREKWPHVTKRAEEMLALYEREIERNPDLIAPAFCFEDIELNQAAGKMSAVLALEEGGILQGSRKLLEHFFEKGVRMITLTWNYPNEIGYPNMNKDLFTPDVEHGLTDTGRELVEAMERLGVIVDVSHLSDAGFYDVAECTGKPFVASHSNARSVCGAARNLTDSMIRILGERGGLTGLNFCPDFLTPRLSGKKIRVLWRRQLTMQGISRTWAESTCWGLEVILTGLADIGSCPVHRRFRCWRKRLEKAVLRRRKSIRF